MKKKKRYCYDKKALIQIGMFLIGLGVGIAIGFLLSGLWVSVSVVFIGCGVLLIK